MRKFYIRETWARKGIWTSISGYFSKDYDGETVMIDATILRAHPCASGYKKTAGPQQRGKYESLVKKVEEVA